jgi:cytochrome c oxidase subunit 4
MSDNHHATTLRANLIVFGILMGLLVLTVGAAYLHLGTAALGVALVIAAIKAGIIMSEFMHLRFSSRLTWVFALGAFLWLGLLIGLSYSDYASRDVLTVRGK